MNGMVDEPTDTQKSNTGDLSPSGAGDETLVGEGGDDLLREPDADELADDEVPVSDIEADERTNQTRIEREAAAGAGGEDPLADSGRATPNENVTRINTKNSGTTAGTGCLTSFLNRSSTGSGDSDRDAANTSPSGNLYLRGGEERQQTIYCRHEPTGELRYLNDQTVTVGEEPEGFFARIFGWVADLFGFGGDTPEPIYTELPPADAIPDYIPVCE